MARLKILGTRAKAEFPATLYPSGGFVCLNLPREASARLGRRSRTPVIGSLNGYPVRTSVFPSGDGGHFMLVNKEMQKGARVSVGDTVRVILEDRMQRRGIGA